MQEQISNVPVQPLTPSSPPIKLWTPSFIAGVTFLLGFPAGIIIVSINWMRMKMNDKANIYLIGGAIGTFILVVILLLIPGNIGRFLGLLTNLGILFYLRRIMKEDIEKFKTSNNVANASQAGGCLIGLGALALFFVMIVAVIIVFTLLGVPMPN